MICTPRMLQNSPIIGIAQSFSVAQTRLATPPESDPSKIAWGLKQDSSLIGTALLLAAKRLIDGGVNPINVEMES